MTGSNLPPEEMTARDGRAAGVPLEPGLRFPASMTPEQIAKFRADFDAEMAANPVPRHLVIPQQRPLLVLHFCWTEDGTARQETYGPWAVAEDESHLEQVFSFLRDWRRLTGCEPSAVTMALLTDPATWAQEREAQRAQDPSPR